MMEKRVQILVHNRSISELEAALGAHGAEDDFVALSLGEPEVRAEELDRLVGLAREGGFALVQSGKTFVFPRTLVKVILPFPRQVMPGDLVADWIQLIASDAGEIRREVPAGETTSRSQPSLRSLRASVKSAIKTWEVRSALGPSHASRRESPRNWRGWITSEPASVRAKLLLGATAQKLRSRTYQRPRASAEFRDERSLRSLRFSLTPDAAPNFNILVPHLKFNQVYGGMATALKLGIEIAKNGTRVRFLCTDSALGEKQREDFGRYLAKESKEVSADLIELADASAGEMAQVSVGENDFFVATAWWTALLADRALREHSFARKRFFYLIQDFEPGFYPWSYEYALAESTYYLSNYIPIFNTRFLGEFFESAGYPASKKSYVIEPEHNLTRFFPAERERMQRLPIRILIYGRPSVPRNLFPLVISSLDEWIKSRRISSEQIEIVSAGERHGDVRFPNGIMLRSVGMVDHDVYPDFLRECDIGISLMLSPHPSYPPLEMAASGMLVITNPYRTKDLSGVSPNFIQSEAAPTAIADALDKAMARANRYDERIAGSRLALPRGLSLEQLAKRLIS